MNIAIISFAHMHAHSYAEFVVKHPEARLTAIWDADEKRGKKAAEQYKATFYGNLETMLQLDVDAVIICSENTNHRKHVVQAANHQKPILCEKPIATEIDDAIEMIKTCKENNVALQIAYPVRFLPAIQEAKEMIATGKIGDVIAVNATNRGKMPGGWFIEKKLSGGGAATDHIVHLMDVLRWMFDDEAHSVYAEYDTRFHDINVEDSGIVQIEMESGMVVSIDPSWSQPDTYPTWATVTMKFIGTEGSLYVDAFRQKVLYYNDKDGAIEEQPWMDDMNESLVYDFIDCIRTGREPFISGEDGLRTLEVVKAAYQSNAEKRNITISRQENYKVWCKKGELT